ncbi:heavy metal-associated isoprenylated plant protein 28-like [Apium graveolens]|uniref:heavy metal-associated isoprenylated plant protein 28-like n=1 Tax=Apium graveolens TaxID=4045 RepID=UPI003D7BCF30
MSTTVEMMVHMDCPGCENKIRKALRRLEGVDDIEIDMGMQKVTVTGWADLEKVLKTARRNGRQAELWPAPGEPEFENVDHYYNNDQYQYQHQSHPMVHTSAEDEYNSSSNYYEQGYYGHEHRYSHQPAHSTIMDRQASAYFSDENTSACSIM